MSHIDKKGIDRLLEQGLSSRKLSFAPSVPKLLETDAVIMVTVGTPSLPSGAADLSYIYHVAQELRNAAQHPLISIMKSTVSSGSGFKLIERYFKDTPIAYVSNLSHP